MRRFLEGLLGTLGINHFEIPDPTEVELPSIPAEEIQKLGIQREADIEVALLDGALREALPKLVGQYADTGSLLIENIDTLANFLMSDETQRVLLNAYRGFISHEHYRLLEVALAARRYRLLGRPGKSIWLIERVARQHPDLRKINNLLATGYIEGLVLKNLETKKQYYGREAPFRFREWFEAQLRTFANAIFVNSNTGVRDIQEGLSKRFIRKRDDDFFVSIWATGEDRVAVTELALREWTEDFPDFMYEVRQGGQGYEPGVEFRVKVRND